MFSDSPIKITFPAKREREIAAIASSQATIYFNKICRKNFHVTAKMLSLFNSKMYEDENGRRSWSPYKCKPFANK